MTVAALLDELAQEDVQISIDDGRLAVDGPEGAVTDDVLSQLRRDKSEILKYLAERVAGGHYADFDHPEIDRQLNTRHPDADEFPEYAAALQLGALVLCRQCQHYEGPFEKQLGWCRHYETETAPDVVSTCGAATVIRRAA